MPKESSVFPKACLHYDAKQYRYHNIYKIKLDSKLIASNKNVSRKVKINKVKLNVCRENVQREKHKYQRNVFIFAFEQEL